MPKKSGDSDKSYRDAGSGKYTTKKHADKNPRTTVGEKRATTRKVRSR